MKRFLIKFTIWDNDMSTKHAGTLLLLPNIMHLSFTHSQVSRPNYYWNYTGLKGKVLSNKRLTIYHARLDSSVRFCFVFEFRFLIIDWWPFLTRVFQATNQNRQLRISSFVFWEVFDSGVCIYVIWTVDTNDSSCFINV